VLFVIVNSCWLPVYFALFISLMEWSSDKVHKFIVLYESHPHLYNVQFANYPNKIKRAASLEEIARQLQTTGKPNLTLCKKEKKLVAYWYPLLCIYV